MLKEPVLTMPSSRLQPSLRVYWKYRSASSTRWLRISASARARWPSSSPKGVSSRARATSMRSLVAARRGAARAVVGRKVMAAFYMPPPPAPPPPPLPGPPPVAFGQRRTRGLRPGLLRPRHRHQNAQRQPEGDHGRAAIADERQRH